MGHALKVWFEDDFDEQGESKLPPGADSRLGWRLADFFCNWFCPGVLTPQQAAPGTIDRYDEMLRYWEAISGNPILLDLGDSHTMAFANELPKWGFLRRGVKKGAKVPIGLLAKHPAYSPLSPTTIAEHVSRLATLLKHAGPRFHPRKPAAEILPRCPYVPMVTAAAEEKMAFSLDDARAMVRAAMRMTRPLEAKTGLTPELWWHCRLAIFYFTGLRAEAVLQLAWEHVENRGGTRWLKVPGEIVKTGKPLEMPLHAQLDEILLRVKAARPAGNLILEPGCGYRHFATLHERLQGEAGIAAERLLSPHAWRRTHLQQIGFLGATSGHKAAQLAADHADERTTRTSYVHDAIVNHCRLQLPPLWRVQGMLLG